MVDLQIILGDGLKIGFEIYLDKTLMYSVNV